MAVARRGELLIWKFRPSSPGVHWLYVRTIDGQSPTLEIQAFGVATERPGPVALVQDHRPQLGVCGLDHPLRIQPLLMNRLLVLAIRVTPTVFL